jgi:hypothetical protein
MKRPCHIEGCERPVRCKGLCQLHYARLRAHGDAMVRLTQRNKGQMCRVEGCEQPAEGRRYCWSHLWREQRYGDAQACAEPRPERTCSVPGCERVIRAYGTCWAHHNRRERGQPMDGPMQRGHRLWQDADCQTAGCGGEVLCKGLCRRCSERERYRRRAGAPSAP